MELTVYLSYIEDGESQQGKHQNSTDCLDLIKPSLGKDKQDNTHHHKGSGNIDRELGQLVLYLKAVLEYKAVLGQHCTVAPCKHIGVDKSTCNSG